MTMLSGKTALVTGASRGIGEAAVRKLADHGANVVLLARSKKDINDLADEIGEGALAVPCDVANYQSAKDAVERAVERFGRLDIVVNNAGLIDPISRLEDADPAEWGNVIDVNLKGVFNVMHAAYPALVKNGGVIVNISSGAATGALEGWSHYCASKAGAQALTRCGHKEWADHGIRVVGLSPGTVATDMQTAIRDSGVNPVSKLAWSDHISPEAVAEAIVWLTRDEAGEYDGTDFSLRTEQGKRAAGLVDGGEIR